MKVFICHMKVGHCNFATSKQPRYSSTLRIRSLPDRGDHLIMESLRLNQNLNYNIKQ